MSWTKRDFITQAFNEIGLASYIFDLTPAQLQSELRRLDAMMATWNGRGIRLSYPLPSSPGDSNIDSVTNVPDSANEAVYTNLAVRTASAYGKIASPDLKKAARDGYQVLLSRATIPDEMQFPTDTVAGSGNRRYRLNYDPYLRDPQNRVLVGPDGPLELN